MGSDVRLSRIMTAIEWLLLAVGVVAMGVTALLFKRSWGDISDIYLVNLAVWIFLAAIGCWLIAIVLCVLNHYLYGGKHRDSEPLGRFLRLF